MRNRTVAFWGNGLRGILSLLMVAALLGTAVQCRAQVSPTDEYSKLVESAQQVSALGAHPFGDNVDLYTGALSFEVTDISVPGIGPTLTLGRTLHTAEDAVDAVDAITGAGGFWRPFGDWDLDIPRIETNAAYQTNVSGWVVGSGSKNRCTGFSKPPPVQTTSPPNVDWNPVDWWYGYHLIVPGHGSQDLLDGGNPPAHQPASGSYPIVTKQDWMIGCGVTASDGGEGFVALSPDGTRYTFAHLVYRPMSEIQRPNGSTGAMADGVHPMENEANFLPRYDAAMYVTQVKDRFGNTLTYNWSGNNLSSIVASDGRELDFSYNSGSPLIHTMIVKAAGGAAARTWTYTYGGTSSMPTLTSVQLPDGSAWSYQIGKLESTTLNTTGGNCVQNALPALHSSAVNGSMTAPSGLTATFTLTPTLHGRSYVPKSCWSPYSGSTTTYANIPNAYYQFSLTQEILSGPGIPAETWKWNYSSPNPSWTSDACASGNSCPSTVYTDVVNPLNQAVRYTFSNRFNASESLLQRMDHYTGAAGSAVLRSETYTYANPTGGPWPGSYGSNLQSHTNFALTGELSPLAKHVISQDGATFTTIVNAFDSFARPTSETESSSLGYSKTNITSYVNDTSRWVLGLVTQMATNGIVASQTSYDSLDQPTSQYSFGRLVSTSAWNTNGTLASIKDGDNHTTTFSNWYRGVPEKITYADGTSQSATVNGNGWITSVTDENGFTTSYGYDAMGRLASIVYPTGDDVAWNTSTRVFQPVNGNEYNIAAGHWRLTETTGNERTQIFYDAFWRPLVTKTQDVANTSGTTSHVVTRYDEGSRLIFKSVPMNGLADYNSPNTGIHTSYDALNRVTQVQQDSELGLLTTATQYLSGFQSKLTNPRGYVTTTSYQAYGEPMTSYPSSITAPVGQLTVIMRDAFGKPLSITRTGTASGSPQITRYYVYDGYQQLCKRIDPESGATAFGYDSAGNMTWSAAGLNLPSSTTCDASAAYGSGRRADRTYDARNRIATLSFPDGNGNQAWTYTPDGLPSTVTRQNNNGSNELVTNSYLYDKRRLLTSEALTQANWYTWTIGYGYDANGHLASQIYPTGFAVSFAPNALGQPTQVGSYATGAHYNPDGSLAGFTYGNGIIHVLTENTRGLPSGIADSGGGVTPMSQTYTYDADGDLTALSDSGNSQQTRTMSYDALDRLGGMNAASLSGQYNYSYDVLNNLAALTHVGGSTNTYHYDSGNRLVSITNPAYPTITLSWDVQGNLATKGGQGYGFDYDNRMRWVNGRESYRYDGLGRRILAWSALDSQNILSVYVKTGQLAFQGDWRTSDAYHSYLYLGSHLVAIVDQPFAGGSSVRYQHTDYQGTVVAQTNASRVIISRSAYDSWGNPRDHGNDDQPGYTGHLQDSLTGLTYMQQRYYDPALSRFLSVDPVDADSESGGNFNRYWYANDNPYRYTDPDGRRGDRSQPNVSQDCAVYNCSTYVSSSPSANTSPTQISAENTSGNTWAHGYVYNWMACSYASPYCTDENVWVARLHYAYPGQDPDTIVQNGKRYSVFGIQGLGAIHVYVNANTRTITNATEPTHIFCCGTVVQTQYRGRDGIYIDVEGAGTNRSALFLLMNYAGSTVWPLLEKPQIAADLRSMH